MLLLAGVAHAEDVVAYEAEGQAPAAGADARVAALDDGFARAVTTALAELVAPDQRAAHRADLDREIIGHARLWVKSYTVTKDETNDDRRQLVLSVRIDRDKLRARLGELGIATADTGPAESQAPGARPAVILLRVATPRGVRADWGDAADKDTPGLGVLSQALRDAGFAVKKAPGAGAAPAATGDLPLDDDASDPLADAAKAELVAIAGVTVGPSVPVRGQLQPAALVTAHVKLIERKGHAVVGQGAAIAAARGEDETYAVGRALRLALADVLPRQPAKLAQAAGFHGDDTPIADPGIVLVRLPPRTPWRLVLEEQKYLAGAKAVKAASLRRLSPSGWVIGVATTEPIDRIAAIARKPPTADSTPTVKIANSIVEVSLTGSP
ncbi:MAG: hypothetical protein ACM31C_30995 [Acidobacteriota bacterium]